MKTVTLKTDDGSIRIEVLRYESNKESNFSDANWLTCKVSINIEPFRGSYTASFTTIDFRDFCEQVDGLLGGRCQKAVFETDEGALSIYINMNHMGTLYIEGNSKTLNSYLKFKLSADRSYLTELKRDLEDVVSSFPVKSVV
jgi:hypothetical protein